ncbi:alpha/beta fold hydrolase [Spirosoma montaniterrae]|uniref:Alpha/beta hydrolase fold-5 domain-containing protein n=1 Tax=Spirosoma montaniterrae TaxID=1178516 RepID=A0A1P9WVB4_9BACT|nr:alpha/beta fold hydrolase [Spirosoma montaniterrae]AQG79336.1 hypothetical protein AWR27_08380 [Spirosoma montaniterrae]
MRFYALLLLVGLSAGACTYLPEPESVAAGTTVSENRTAITVTTTRGVASTTGFIFYPGALVDPHAYVGLMELLADAPPGYRVFIAKVPANLAVLQPEAARSIMDEHPEIRTWVIGGHSLGGAMACTWVRRNPESVRGLVLLAAYPAGADNLSGWSGGVLSVYGTNDEVLNAVALAEAKDRLPKQTITTTIAGGNHAYFGNYGEQKGDGTATVSRREQQLETARQFIGFMKTLGL